MIRMPVLVAFLLLCGCGGGGGGPTGTLSGTVTLKGAPLESGSINFLAADKTMYQAAIVSGTYRVEGIPVGDVKVSVVGRESALSPADAKEAAGPAPNPKIAKAREKKKKRLASTEIKQQPISHTYGDAETSGLKTTVKAGENNANFDLK